LALVVVVVVAVLREYRQEGTRLCVGIYISILRLHLRLRLLVLHQS
jgi:hypothetical protein